VAPPQGGHFHRDSFPILAVRVLGGLVTVTLAAAHADIAAGEQQQCGEEDDWHTPPEHPIHGLSYDHSPLVESNRSES